MTVLAGKVVLVAGASSGIGRATALAAAEAGARVVALARRAAALEELTTEIDRSGAEATAIATDATDRVATTDAVTTAVRRHGRLDALVNCIGTNIPERSLDQLTDTSWNALLEVNLTAAFVLTQAVLPPFRSRQDGLIVHVSSAAVKRPDASGVAYQAAKAGLAGLAFGTMEEERDNGIRVSVVYPGLTDTALVAKRPTPVPEAVLRQAIQPEDVAAICVALVGLAPRAYVPEVSVWPSRLKL